MYKRLEFFPEDKNGVEMELIHPGVLVKTASLSSELEAFIAELAPEEGKVYILVNALSAGEYYGSNRNGDYISEPVLQKYHKHFEEQGHVYKHHKNKDPNRALGKILFSSYNSEMHRVELICELDKTKDDKFVSRIQNGEYPAVSMGMRTPYDICSYCGHKSKQISEYCNHLKYQMNKTHPDGRKNYAINPAAKFFDLSFVIIPAERTAGVMRKLASGVQVVSARPSAELGEEFLRTAGLKESDLTKHVEIPTEVKEIQKDTKGNIYLSQPDIPKEDIRAMVKNASTGEIFSTLMGMRIMPKPIDFQRIVLYSQGHEKIAEELEKKNICLINVTKEVEPYTTDDINLDYFNDDLAKKYAHLIPNRSLSKPLVTARIIEKLALYGESRMEKEGIVPPKPDPLNNDSQSKEFYLKKEPSSVSKLLFSQTEEPNLLPYKNPIFASAALSSLFYGLQKTNNALLGPAATGKFDAFLLRRPWLIPILLGVGSLVAVKVQKDLHKKAGVMVAPDAITRYLLAVPASYIYAGHQESKVRKGEPIGGIQNLVRKHPFLTSILAGWGLGKVQRSLLKVSSIRRDTLQKAIYDLSPERLDKLFVDTINT